MQHRNTRVMVAAAWILAVCLVVLVADLSLVGAVIVLAACGFVPPLLMHLGWRTPPQSLSETIQEALR